MSERGGREEGRMWEKRKGKRGRENEGDRIRDERNGVQVAPPPSSLPPLILSI